MIEIRMPRLSESMTEGKLLLWNVAVGDHVHQGDQVAEIEADKANMEIEAPVSGIICEINGSPGDKLPVGAVLALLRQGSDEPAGSVPSSGKAKSVSEEEDSAESPLQKRLKQFESKA